MFSDLTAINYQKSWCRSKGLNISTLLFSLVFALHTQIHTSGVRLLICCCEGAKRIMLLMLPERKRRCISSCKCLHLQKRSHGRLVELTLAVEIMPFTTIIPVHIHYALQSTLQGCSLPLPAPLPSKCSMITDLSWFLSLSPNENKQFIFSTIAVPFLLAWHITYSQLAWSEGGQRLALISNSA